MNENKIMENFITRLQTVLKEKKLSQTELALKIGISRESFTYWKNTNSLPNSEILFKIADYVETDPYWLAKGVYPKYGIKEWEQNVLNKMKKMSQRDRDIIFSLCDILLNEKPVSPESETG